MRKLKIGLPYISVIIALVYFIVILETMVVSSVAKQLAEYLNVLPKNMIKINIGFSLSGFLVPLLGYNADKYGSKKMIGVGLLLFMTGTALTSTSQTLGSFMVYRFLTGMGHYSVVALIFAYTAHFVDYKNRGKLAGFLKMAFGVAVFVAPFYSTFFVRNFEPTTMYLVMSIFAGVLFILFLPLPKVEDIKEVGTMMKSFSTILKNPDIIKFLIVLSMFGFSGAVYFAYLPFGLDARGLEQLEIRNVFVFISGATFAASFTILKLSDKVGKFRLMIIGSLISFIALVGVNINILYVHLALAILFVYGLDVLWGLFFTVGAQMVDRGKATLLSIMGLVVSFSNMIGALIGPMLYEIGEFKFVVRVIAVTVLVGVILIISLNKKYKEILN